MKPEIVIPRHWYTWKIKRVNDIVSFDLKLMDLRIKQLKETWGRVPTIDQTRTPRFVFDNDEDAIMFKLAVL